jgi:hypothetical protein
MLKITKFTVEFVSVLLAQCPPYVGDLVTQLIYCAWITVFGLHYFAEIAIYRRKLWRNGCHIVPEEANYTNDYCNADNIAAPTSAPRLSSCRLRGVSRSLDGIWP